MKEKFKLLPVALQKQILLRISLGIFFLLLFIVVLICLKDLYMYLPCLLFAGFLIGNGSLLLYNSLGSNYVCVQGVCEHIEKIGIHKRIKSIRIISDKNSIIISIRQRIKHLSVGDTIVVYLSKNTPVYDQNSGYLICSYYALESRKEV